MFSRYSKIFNNAFNLPNSLSFFRLLLIIPFYIFLPRLHEEPFTRYIIMGLIFIAFLSDLLDGYLARKLNLVTEFGKIIDPISDKILVVFIVIQLFLLGEIPSIYVYVIVIRDVIIFIGGIILSKKIGKVLPSNLIGKMAVFSIGLYILSILVGLRTIDFFYRFFFYTSIILSFASVIAYALRGYESLKWKNDEHT